LEWRSCLDQVLERGGALEIAVLRPQETSTAVGSHLVWRVRILHLTDDEILVEPPMALGEVMRVEEGVKLVAVLAVGQNRWMFKTSHLGPTEYQRRGQRPITAMRLAMPPSVERCQRRNYFRMDTGTVVLPEVEVWPLLDPKSVLIAERSNELQFEEDRKGNGRARSADGDNEMILPEVGPKFTAMLLNIGGGGLGLRVRPDDAQSLARHKIFWLRFTLPPELTTPICATAKLAHTNVDSTQHTYAGLAFDFSFNPVHQRFIVEQICEFIALQQRDQAA
jgi:hypothetical protein